MRKFSILAAALIVASGVAVSGSAMPQSATQTPAAVQKPPEPTVQAPASMQAFAAPDGRFKILLPGTPKQQTKPITLEGGVASTLHQFWVDMDGDNVTYMVIYNDFPTDYANGSPQDLLESTRDGMVADKTLTSDVPIDLYGVPGRSFTASDKQGWLYAVHQFFDGNRLYQLIVVDDSAHPAILTEQFMNSFRIVKDNEEKAAGSDDLNPPPASDSSQ